MALELRREGTGTCAKRFGNAADDISQRMCTERLVVESLRGERMRHVRLVGQQSQADPKVWLSQSIWKDPEANNSAWPGIPCIFGGV